MNSGRRLGRVGLLSMLLVCAGLSASGPGVEAKAPVVGTISGSVSDATSLTPLSGITVQIYSAAGVLVTTAVSNGDGSYSVDVEPGSYLARTAVGAMDIHIDKLHPNIRCFNGCPVTAGQPINVVASTTTGNIDFALDRGGSISGTVTDSSTGNPIAGLSIQIATLAATVKTVVTDGSGQFLATGLPQGDYAVFTQASAAQNYVDEMFNVNGNTSCPCQIQFGAGVAVTPDVVSSGINFSLDPGGSVTGVVTDANSAAPIPGMTVTIANAVGVTIKTVVADGSGVYIARGLPVGTYYARTSANATQNYVDELYGGIACPVSCLIVTGTPIAVAIGTRTGIDFQLSGGGTVTGTVTRTSDGTPIEGMIVQLQGPTIKSVLTNGAGVFVATGLPAGTYTAHTASSPAQSFVDQAYNNLSCFFYGCPSFIGGSPITVVAGGTASGINFALSAGGSLSGTVTDQSTGLPIGNIAIRVVDNNGFMPEGHEAPYKTVNTDASGAFTIAGLPTNSYFARTAVGPADNYVDKAFNNAQCFPSCFAGTAISVTTGANTTGINFVLARGGSISGAVTDAQDGSPIGSVQVVIYSSTEGQVKSVLSSGDGTFLAAGLPSGTYYARTFVSVAHNYVDQVYSGISCFPSCSVGSGTPIAVTAGATAGGINFALNRGGTISGTVTDTVGVPLSIDVNVSTATGTSVKTVTADALGHFTVAGLPTGSYRARTVLPSGSNYLDELYGELPCYPSCAVVDGTPIAVTAGGTTGIAFSLAASGRISGVVTSEATGLPISSGAVVATNVNNSASKTVPINADGSYSIIGLATGSYTVTANAAGHYGESWDNCNRDCTPTNVVVTAGSTTTGINFALSATSGTGSISGLVFDAANPSTKLATAWIEVFNSSGSFVTQAFTGPAGEPYVVSGLAAGQYFLRTNLSSNHPSPYSDQLYHDIFCLRIAFQCPVTTGTPVSVTSGQTTTADFGLHARGTLSGIVRDAVTTTAIGADVEIYAADGTRVTTVSSLQPSGYSALVAPGTYYVRTRRSDYFDKAYNNIPCPATCNVLASTPVTVTAGATTGNVNFDLVPNSTGTLFGHVTDAGTGAVAPGYDLDLYGPDGKPVSAGGNLGNFYQFFLSPGTYFLRTRTSNYIDEVYDNKPCLGCSVLGGTPIVVTSGQTSTADFALVAGGSITGSVTDAATTALLNNARVRVYTATGVFIKESATVGGSYTLGGLSTGTYYLVATKAGYSSGLYSSGLCLGACDVTAGTPVSVTTGATTAGINFALNAGATIGGTIRDAVTGTGVNGFGSALTAHLYTQAGVDVLTATVDSTGRYSFDVVTPGSYYVRSMNTLGYIDEVYDNVTISGNLAPTAGTLITVAGGEIRNGINFDLASGGGIAGAITNQTSGLPLSQIKVAVYASNGQLVKLSAPTSASGTFSVPGLQPGNYYARTMNSSGYQDKLFAGSVPCAPDCHVTSGTPIVVTAGVVSGGVNFSLSAGTELIQNGNFSEGINHWALFATPDMSYIQWQIAGRDAISPDMAFMYYKVPPPSGSNQAVILQNTNAPQPADSNLLATFDLTNTSSARRRISVLIHEADFSDLSVCTFWLPANSGERRYSMRTRTTKAWLNASISFYAASDGGAGGVYILDNVSMQSVGGQFVERTDCIDPTHPGSAGGPDGAEMLVNGDFSAATTGWTVFGQLTSQVAAGVFEFFRPSANPDPAGGILQATGQAIGAGETLTATMEFGNSSAVRKRVTVLLHDLNFTDLSACTFWIEPGQAPSSYTMRAFTTQAWANATISIYAASVGDETWTRLDNVSLKRTPGAPATGVECVEPGGGPSPAALAEGPVRPGVSSAQDRRPEAGAPRADESCDENRNTPPHRGRPQ